MKTIGKKFLTTLIVILLLFNFIYSNYSLVFAAESVQFNDIVNVLTYLLGGVVGVFTWIPRLIAMALGLVINVLTAQIAYMDDTTAGANVSNTAVITPFNIFFNDVQLLDVNFLDLSIDSSSTTYVIREQVAQWYYIMRLIATAILLVILIFVGIKMAISTVAEEKAIYKKTLVDWATSLALVFLLHYIIMFTINANSAIVNAMKSVVDTTGVDNTIRGIALKSLQADWQAIGATVVYCIFVFQTIAFLFTYIKRMLTIGFLIIISPLISITYSIDRMGDSKAQALNTWLKEFIYGILIQPFHCVMYMAFLDTAFNLLKTPGLSDLPNAIFAILCMRFIDDGEKIVRKIFGFESASSVSPLATAAAAGVVMNGGKMAVNAANTVRKGINMSKQSGLLSAINKDKATKEERRENRINKRAEKDAKKAYAADGKKDWNSLSEEEKSNKIAAARKANEEKFNNSKIGEISKKMNDRREEHRQNRATKVEEKTKEILGEKKYNELKEKEKAGSLNDAEKKALDNARQKADNTTGYKNLGRPVRAIKGFSGKVTNAIDSTAVGRYIRTTGIRKMTSAGVGLAIGGMALGASNTGVLTAAGAGIGVYQGVDTFRATSTKTLAQQSSPYLDGRVSSKEECAEHIKNVKANGDNGAYNGNSEEVKELISNLKNILMGMNYSKKEATDKVRDIQNKINYEAADDPKNIDVNSILQSIVGDKAQNAELQQAAGNFANHTLDANLYSLMQKGASMQMGTDEFIKHMNNYVQFEPKTTTDNSTVTPVGGVVETAENNVEQANGSSVEQAPGGSAEQDPGTVVQTDGSNGEQAHGSDEVTVIKHEEVINQVLQSTEEITKYESIVAEIQNADEIESFIRSIEKSLNNVEQQVTDIQKSNLEGLMKELGKRKDVILQKAEPINSEDQ